MRRRDADRGLVRDMSQEEEEEEEEDVYAIWMS